ncbi:MAG: hypothetical protein AAFQ87_21620 [Bacteroidota bacterium]
MTTTDFIAQFEAHTLPVSEWTHAAHIRTALWYVHHYGLEAALCYLRSGIITYNASVGGQNTPEGGYHETLTIFWTEAVAHWLADAEVGDSFGERWAAAEESYLMDKQLPFRYWTKERLMSTGARARWLEPDLQPW